jgi:hypothetical protein
VCVLETERRQTAGDPGDAEQPELSTLLRRLVRAGVVALTAVSSKLTFLSSKLTCLSSKLTFLSSKLSVLSSRGHPCSTGR